MKRIYLLMILFVAFVGSAIAQRNVDLTIKHYYSASSTVALMKNGDKLLINGSNPYYFAWNIKNNGPDSTMLQDTIRIKTPWTTFVAFAGVTFTKHLKMGDSINITPQTNPVTLNPGSGITKSGPVMYDWCDSVSIKHQSTNTSTVTDPGVPNNRTCNNVEVNYWLTGINGEVLDNTQAFLLYPNPATSKLNITYNFGNNNKSSVKVIDVTGRIVYTQDLGNMSGVQDVQVNMPEMNTGLYILQLASGEKTMTQRFHIQ